MEAVTFPDSVGVTLSRVHLRLASGVTVAWDIALKRCRSNSTPRIPLAVALTYLTLRTHRKPWLRIQEAQQENLCLLAPERLKELGGTI